MSKKETLHEAMFRLGRLNIMAVIPDLCQAEVVVLKTIADCVSSCENPDEGVKVSAVVSELCVAPPAVSRTMNSLEEKGLIIRRVNKSDRRNMLVTLTEAGWKKKADNEQLLSDLMRKIFARVGEDKVKQTIDSINEIYEATREELNLIKKERGNK